MSTFVLNDHQHFEVERYDLTLRAIDTAQQTAARVAGVIYLFTMVTTMVALNVRGQLSAHGDPLQTAKMAAFGRLFQLSIVSDLFTLAAVIMLVAALYVLLEPVNREVAFLAACLLLVECSIAAVIALTHLAAVALLGGADHLLAFDTTPLRALVYRFFRVPGAGYHLGQLFLGLGSTMFAYLWFKSRYIPRGLAACGILSSLVVAIVESAIMVFPTLAAVVKPTYWAPLFIFEIALGFWLLVKGVQAPTVELRPSGETKGEDR